MTRGEREILIDIIDYPCPFAFIIVVKGLNN